MHYYYGHSCGHCYCCGHCDGNSYDRVQYGVDIGISCVDSEQASLCLSLFEKVVRECALHAPRVLCH